MRNVFRVTICGMGLCPLIETEGSVCVCVCVCDDDDDDDAQVTELAMNNSIHHHDHRTNIRKYY